MRYLSFPLLALLLLLGACGQKETAKQQLKTLQVQTLDLSKVEQGWEWVHVNKNLTDDSLRINGTTYRKGFATHAESEILIKCYGDAEKFTALVGLDQKVADLDAGDVAFKVFGDGNLLQETPIHRGQQAPYRIEVDLEGIELLRLFTTDGGDGYHHDHADWIRPTITYRSKKPSIYYPPDGPREVLCPPIPDTPRFNYPRLIGASPGKPFLFRLPVSGQRPISFRAQGLPRTIALDQKKGILKGTAPDKGIYKIRITSENEQGKSVDTLVLKSGYGLALTPPMGWASWNAYDLDVSQAKVAANAQAFIDHGLANFGFRFLNIDDGWQADSAPSGQPIPANSKFPDMAGLAQQIHQKGLKVGIYSSPGPTTCGQYPGSYHRETEDLRQWAQWGIDYLKYDYCGYKKVLDDTTTEAYAEPYFKMGRLVEDYPRDLVYAICCYGSHQVWNWGQKAGGNLWRTTQDLTDTWLNLRRIGFRKQVGLAPYSGPGHWNDPDMLVVGKLGLGGKKRQSRLSPAEQYTHLSQWALLAAPLLLSCDLTAADEFTRRLVQNHQLLAINQDTLGKQARQVYKKNEFQVWVRPLSDGSKAVGLYNLGATKRDFTWDLAELGLGNQLKVMDVWTHTTHRPADTRFATALKRHGCRLLRVWPQKQKAS